MANRHQSTRIVLYFALSLIGYAVLQFDFLGYGMIQFCLSVIFVVTATFEYKRAKYPFLVYPPAVFTIYVLINNIFSGLWYFALDYSTGVDEYGNYMLQFEVADKYIVEGTWYSILAVHVLWLVFYFFPDSGQSNSGTQGRVRLPIAVIYLLYGISIASFIIGVNLGVLGYTASGEDVRFLTYITFGFKLGLLAIIILAIYDYDDSKRRMLLYLGIILNVGMGFLYGAKSVAVMPVVLFIVALYFAGREIKKKYIVAFGLGVVAAFIVIEPLRIYFDSTQKGAEVKDVRKLATLYYEARTSGDSQASYLRAFFERHSYVVPLAKTIEFSDEREYYHSEEWKNLALAPLYGTIPRFIWESKPLSNFGQWASVNIFGLPDTSHTGITPQGYAYMVWRVPGIILFFSLGALIQRIIFNTLYLNKKYIPLYILMYLEIGYVAVVPYTFIAGTIQQLILLTPFILLLNYFSGATEAHAERLSYGN